MPAGCACQGLIPGNSAFFQSESEDCTWVRGCRGWVFPPPRPCDECISLCSRAPCAAHVGASAGGGGDGRARGSRRAWTPRRPAVAVVACVVRGGPGRLGDRRWPQSLGQVARDGCICGEARAAGACNNSLDEATTVRCRLGAPIVGRRSGAGCRSRHAAESGERNPSFGERPAVSKGTPGAAPYAGEKSGSRITGYSRVHPGRTHAYRGRSGTWWSKAVRETGVPAQRRGAVTAGTTATHQPPTPRQPPPSPRPVSLRSPASKAPPSISLEKTIGAKLTRSGFTAARPARGTRGSTGARQTPRAIGRTWSRTSGPACRAGCRRRGRGPAGRSSSAR